jgi:hypothetical protein
MNPNTSLVRAVLVAVVLGAAVPLGAETVPPVTTPQPKAGKAAPAVPETKPEEEPKIPGVVIARPNGAFLGLTLENGNFKLAFYSPKKLPVPADVARANARWPVHYTVFDEHAILTPTTDGMALTSTKFVRPPYVFKFYLTLIVDGSAEPPESYVIDFHQ